MKVVQKRVTSNVRLESLTWQAEHTVKIYIRTSLKLTPLGPEKCPLRKGARSEVKLKYAFVFVWLETAIYYFVLLTGGARLQEMTVRGGWTCFVYDILLLCWGGERKLTSLFLTYTLGSSPPLLVPSSTCRFYEKISVSAAKIFLFSIKFSQFTQFLPPFIPLPGRYFLGSGLLSLPTPPPFPRHTHNMWFFN